MTTLLIDCDGILLDFETPGMAAAERITGVFVAPEARVFCGWDLIDAHPKWQEKREEILAAWEAEGFCSSLEPIPGAADFLRDLRASGISEIFAVTTHMHRSKTWVWEREQSLEKYFGKLLDGYIHTRHKENVAGDFFIDDKVSNVRKWKDKHPTKQGIVLDHYGYSRDDYDNDNWPPHNFSSPNGGNTYYTANYPNTLRILSLLRR